MAQVVPFVKEFEKYNTRVVAVSFGTPYWAQVWLEETNAPFPIWLDPARESYDLYGMSKSVLNSWGVQNLWFYAKALAQGKKLQENRGPTDQMGGNFIIDASGIVRFAYPSKNPTDRPSVSCLLKEISALPPSVRLIS